MPTPPLSDEALQEAVDALNKCAGNRTAAAQSLSMNRLTFQSRIKLAAERGLMGTEPVLEGFRLSQTTAVYNEAGDIVREFVQQKPERGEEFAPPAGHRVKGISALVDESGRVINQWVKTTEGQLDPLQLAEHLKAAFLDYVPSPPLVPVPSESCDDLLTVLPCNDWHVNMAAWGKQVGTAWDNKIAEIVIGNATADTLERSPASAECVVLGGGDLLHVNGKSNTTANGTPQDVDSRYQKGVEVITRLMVHTVNAALRRHRKVIVRILKGNHDEDSSVAIVYFLAAWYRNEPRVTVDTDPSDYFWHRFGKVLLGATHGHQTSNHITKMPGIMAHRRAEDWGATKHRYVHGFHLHHSAKIATEGNGVICEIHQAPIPQDAWHFGSGFLSGRSIQAITYHRQHGEIGRVRTAILDGQKS